MSLTIYGTPYSRAIRVFWVAEELGIPYETVAIDFKDTSDGPAGKNNPAFRKASPMGRVPAIDDGGLKLFESLAITLHLAKKHGQGLWPATPAGESMIFQWTLFASSELDGNMVDWARHAFVLPEAERDPAKAAAALEKLAKPVAALEAALALSPWLTGDTFTVADLNVAATMFRAKRMDLSASPHVAKWLAACFARPAAKKAWAMRGE